MHEPKRPQTSTYQAAKKPVMPLWTYAIGLLVMLLLGLGLGRYWGNEPTENIQNTSELPPNNTKFVATSVNDSISNHEKAAVLTVEVISAKKKSVGNNLSADGTVEGKNIANVSGRVNGVAIEKILVDEGDWVKAGQTLAVFDAKGLEQNAIEAQAGVAEAQANYAHAVANAERVLPLLDINAVSQQEVDHHVAAVEQAKAALVSAQARFNGTQLTLQDTKVIAPVSGIISSKQAQIGSIPQQALFRIIENGVLEWQAKVSPEQLKLIGIGMPVIVKTPTNDWIDGKVTRIVPQAGDDRRMTVVATLENSRQVQAGMLLHGEFVLDSQPQTVVPVAAVVSHDGYDYLMLVRNITEKDGISTGTVKRLKVELGKQIDTQVVVKSELPANAMIIRQGGGFLNDGDKVRVVASNNNLAGVAD